MNIPRSPLLVFVAGSVCATAYAELLRDNEIDHASSARLRAAYLECDRISAASRVEPDFMSSCERVSRVLRDRDFGGSFERQLAWWKSARATAGAPAEQESVRTGGRAEELPPP